MTKKLIYTLVLSFSAVLIYGLISFFRLKKEKKIFGGLTKQEFIKRVTKEYKLEYYNGMRNWLKDKSNAKGWFEEIEGKALETKRDYKDQLELEIDFMWMNQSEPLLQPRKKERWTNGLAKEVTESLGVDFNNSDVKKALSLIQKF